MADSKQLNLFVKHVLLAAKRQGEEKVPAVKPAEIKPIQKKLAGSFNEEIKNSLKELDTRLDKVYRKEEDLFEASEEEHKDSAEIKSRLNNLTRLNLEDMKLIGILKDQVKALEYELRFAERKRSDEVSQNKSKLEEIKSTVSELKERISRLIEDKKSREERFARLERALKDESLTSRQELEHIDEELAKIKEFEEKPRRIGFFEKLRFAFRKKPKIEDFVKPEEQELFKKELAPLPKRASMQQRPLVRHEILFEEAKAKPGIPREEKMLLPPMPRPPMFAPKELPPPPKPSLLLRRPEKKKFFNKVKDLFRKK
jgi:DNA repair exonuclease SbcCD ATPase subunit